jgi:hypothetical protein
MTREEMEEFFGAPISVYTRAQAIADGVLVDVTTVAREAGFTIPFAVTQTVQGMLNNIPAHLQGIASYQGRLWDLLMLARHAVAQHGGRGGDRLPFTFSLPTSGTRKQNVTLHLHIGGGDDGSPCLTAMTETED